ncbi:AT06280p [Strongyloides ratti]|uniref:AT06280p n=1 Tax=Strongyloides ratti TaxID=34506 RepID=A0A090LNN3_STRRB|nr:AT06280p [Strongyloides ratti]CEF69774.1 AT06280p [Strongyloides ratti]
MTGVDGTQNTYPCSICGRKFVRESLEKHEIACQKINTKKRKVFDSGKQRATGSDINYKDIKKVQLEKQKLGGTFPRPKTNWKERHETFIGAVSASKQVEIAIKTGAPLPPPPKATVPNDYIECEYCGRNFNEKAAERHIPFCKEQSMRKKTPVSRSASASRAILTSGKSPTTSAPTKREPLLSKGISSKEPIRRGSIDKTSIIKSTNTNNNVSHSKITTTSKKTSNLPIPTKRSNSSIRNSSSFINSSYHQNLPIIEVTNEGIKQYSGILGKDTKMEKNKRMSSVKKLPDTMNQEDYYIEYQKYKDETLKKSFISSIMEDNKLPTSKELDYDFD